MDSPGTLTWPIQEKETSPLPIPSLLKTENSPKFFLYSPKIEILEHFIKKSKTILHILIHHLTKVLRPMWQIDF